VRPEVQPVTADRWDDLADLFERRGPRGGTPITHGCWCMWWRQRTGNWERNRQAMERLVREGHEPSLLAYESGAPVRWVSIGPREEFGQLVRSRTYRPIDEQADVFSIVCFYVYPTAKRHGIATALLEAALEYARGRGATAVEAYPLEKPDYMGSRSSFERLGFEAVRQAGKRTVMRRDLLRRS
jgi:GNAT superfamily N-acetyltransferase